MSSYKRMTKHPETGKWEEADWLDDYFRDHHYGVRFPNGQVFDPENIKLEVDYPIQQNGEKKECSVCHKPFAKIMGTCLCMPSHGSWHLECDPHEVQPSRENDKMRFHELAVEMGEFMTVREENVNGTTIGHLALRIQEAEKRGRSAGIREAIKEAEESSESFCCEDAKYQFITDLESLIQSKSEQ